LNFTTHGCFISAMVASDALNGLILSCMAQVNSTGASSAMAARR
jgi:hypothetical protein